MGVVFNSMFELRCRLSVLDAFQAALLLLAILNYRHILGRCIYCPESCQFNSFVESIVAVALGGIAFLRGMYVSLVLVVDALDFVSLA